MNVNFLRIFPLRILLLKTYLVKFKEARAPHLLGAGHLMLFSLGGRITRLEKIVFYTFILTSIENKRTVERQISVCHFVGE